MVIKFIDPKIYMHIMKSDKTALFLQRDQLIKEMEQGLLVGSQYIKELELINERINT